jgi:cobalt/nickel transport system permease protein
MNPTRISDHIPDIDLITTYAEHQTGWMSRMSPWTKLVTLILIVILITISRNFPILLALYAGIMVAYWQNGLPVRRLIAWYMMPIIFVISLVGILVWSEPGTPIFTIPLIIMHPVLTDNGILLMTVLLLKALITFSYSLLFLMTTRYLHFSGMIYRIVPSPLDQIFLMTYRFLFLTLAMTRSLLKAVYSRGGGLIHSVRTQSKLFAAIAGLTFIRSFEQAERVNQAMTARGYSSGSYGSRTRVPPPSHAEYLLLIIASCGVALAGWGLPAAGGWII